METRNLLYQKIKVALATLNMNDAYIASEYLARIIFYMIYNKDDSSEGFKKAVDIVRDKFNLAQSTIRGCIGGMLNKCSKAMSAKFEMTKSCSIYQRTLALKQHILANI